MIVSAASTVAPPENTAKRPKHACSGDAEQFVAPVDRGAQGLLASGCVSRARSESAESVAEAISDLAGREEPGAGRRQLDREWEPIEPPTDRLHRRRPYRPPNSNRGSWARARSQNSAIASHASGERLGVVEGCPGPGQCQRRHGVALLGGDRQRLAAGGQHGDCWDTKAVRRRTERQPARVRSCRPPAADASGAEVALDRPIGGKLGHASPPTIPSALTIAAATSCARSYGRERHNCAPSANSASTVRASSRASLVLPTPPGPVRVSSRAEPVAQQLGKIASSSRSRPMVRLGAAASAGGGRSAGEAAVARSSAGS